MEDNKYTDAYIMAIAHDMLQSFICSVMIDEYEDNELAEIVNSLEVLDPRLDDVWTIVVIVRKKQKSVKIVDCIVNRIKKLDIECYVTSIRDQNIKNNVEFIIDDIDDDLPHDLLFMYFTNGGNSRITKVKYCLGNIEQNVVFIANNGTSRRPFYSEDETKVLSEATYELIRKFKSAYPDRISEFRMFMNRITLDYGKKFDVETLQLYDVKNFFDTLLG